MKFCNNCNNVLYTSLNEEDGNTLIYYCRNCGVTDEIIEDELLVVMNSKIKNTKTNFSSFINEYTKYDPTIPRLMKKCPNDSCPTNKIEIDKDKKNNSEDDNKSETLYVRYDDNELKYLYMCINCDTVYTN